MYKKVAKKIYQSVRALKAGGRATSSSDKASSGTRASSAPHRAPARTRKDRPRPSGRRGRSGSRSSEWALDDFRVEPREGEKRFHDFDLPLRIMHAIADLGFQYCTPIQAQVLAHLGSGRDIAGRAQTGTGKTAGFLITMFSLFLKEGRGKPPTGRPKALVLAPTRELVLQILNDALDLAKYCPFQCLAVYGGMDLEKQRQALERKSFDLIVATPGRLLDFLGRGVLNLKEIEILVIDEADRMLDMGFVPDVRRIIRTCAPKNKRQTMLFSATLSDRILELASGWMTDPVFCEVESENVTVDAIEQVVYITTSRNKFRLLYNILQSEDATRVLIFGNRRDSTRRLMSKLREHGVKCGYLAGSVEQKERLRVLESFRDGNIRVVVATDVAGRGIHVDDVSHVINYDFPYEAPDYVHRIGRTGRAGKTGKAISFACEEESFVIPEIEEYIGAPLPCRMPDDDLLREPPTRGSHGGWRR